jgi:hypothetical protein
LRQLDLARYAGRPVIAQRHRLRHQLRAASHQEGERQDQEAGRHAARRRSRDVLAQGVHFLLGHGADALARRHRVHAGVLQLRDGPLALGPGSGRLAAIHVGTGAVERKDEQGGDERAAGFLLEMHADWVPC